MDRKTLSFYWDKIWVGILLTGCAIILCIYKKTISDAIRDYYGSAEGVVSTAFLIGEYTLLLFGVLIIIGGLIKPHSDEEPTDPTPTEKSKTALEEYKQGNKFSQSYITASWTATSIFLPVCFGLVAVSYTAPLSELPRISLLALAIASISLFLFWWAYTNRYASYNRSIWKRLQQLEKHPSLQMYLHRQIERDDKKRAIRWRIRHVNLVMLILLLLSWIARLSIPT